MIGKDQLIGCKLKFYIVLFVALFLILVHGVKAYCWFDHFHWPSSDEESSKRASEEQTAREAQDKLNEGKPITIYEAKCLNEHNYRDTDYPCREGNEPSGNGTYDRNDK
jgi:hypothetical protein